MHHPERISPKPAHTSADGVIVAIDGGGSKTDGVAFDHQGNVLAHLRTTGSAFDRDKTQESVLTVDHVVTELHSRTVDRDLAGVHIYLSGLDTATEIDEFTTLCSSMWWAPRQDRLDTVDNDMFALLRAGTDELDAVAVICGTGLNCVGTRHDGQRARFLAWGLTSGDWGGGWNLGQHALWHAARAVDRRGPKTTLVADIPRALGFEDLGSVMEAFHFDRIATQEFAKLAPVVLDACTAGDQVATQLVDTQADEIVRMAVSATRRLDLLDTSIPVVLGGGLIDSGHTRLLEGIRSGLRAEAPLTRPQIVRDRPILGAALLALEASGGNAEALNRLRDQIRSHEPF